MIGALIVFAWFSCGHCAAAAASASDKIDYPTKRRRAPGWYVAMYSLLYLMGPISLFGIGFATGFFQDGFNWPWWRIK